MKNWISVVLAGVALAGTATVVEAGDNRRDGSIKDGRGAVHSWAGFYLGAHAGWAWVDIDDTYDLGSVRENTFGFDADGFIGGFHGGYNFQSGNVVAGIEVDWSWSNVDGTALCPVPTCAGSGTNPTVKLDNTASVRGRLGYAADRTLWFLTAGVAFADVHARDPLQGGGAARDSKNHMGFIVGGGVEWAAMKHLSLRVEYLFTDYEDINYKLGSTPDKLDLEMHTVRAGVTWHFGK